MGKQKWGIEDSRYGKPCAMKAKILKEMEKARKREALGFGVCICEL